MPRLPNRKAREQMDANPQPGDLPSNTIAHVAMVSTNPEDLRTAEAMLRGFMYRNHPWSTGKYRITREIAHGTNIEALCARPLEPVN